MAVETVPEGHPAIPILATERGGELLAFLERAFAARLLDRQDGPDGGPSFLTLRLGDTVLSVMRPRPGCEPTRSAFYVYVDDVAAAHRRAVDAGARSIQEPSETVHGDRMATVIDPFGNQWTLATSLERITVAELHRRLGR